MGQIDLGQIGTGTNWPKLGRIGLGQIGLGTNWPVSLDTTLCDKVCQWLAAGLWFSPGTPVSSTNKPDCHNIAEILLKVTLNTIP